MVYWSWDRILLLKYSGIVIIMLVSVFLYFVLGVDKLYAFLIGFIVFIIYVVFIVRNVEKDRKELIKEYIETGNEEALEKAFPSHRSSKK